MTIQYLRKPSMVAGNPTAGHRAEINVGYEKLSRLADRNTAATWHPPPAPAGSERNLPPSLLVCEVALGVRRPGSRLKPDRLVPDDTRQAAPRWSISRMAVWAKICFLRADHLGRSSPAAATERFAGAGQPGCRQPAARPQQAMCIALAIASA